MTPARTRRPRPADMPIPDGARSVWTDGACSGNPGPGGWAWALSTTEFAAGAENPSTNQRMEIRAALEAVQSLPGPLLVVSDSTYVVNCFRDRWHDGWMSRGWVTSARTPVANRDLWEPLIELFVAGRFGVPRWVATRSAHLGRSVPSTDRRWSRISP